MKLNKKRHDLKSMKCQELLKMIHCAALVSHESSEVVTTDG